MQHINFCKKYKKKKKKKKQFGKGALSIVFTPELNSSLDNCMILYFCYFYHIILIILIQYEIA